MAQSKLPPLGDAPDRSWERHGRTQAYYGVLSSDKFRTENLNDALLAEFMQSGSGHLKELLSFAEGNFGPIARNRALDFGCGVGRVLLPMAELFAHSTGIDVAESMRAEAQRNADRAGLGNIALACNPEGANGTDPNYDFIHSVMVFQHIPVARGEAIISALLKRLASGGVAALHINLRTHQSWWRRFGSILRKRVAPLNILANIINRRPWNEPMMQMNEYRLDRIFEMVVDLGFTRMLVHPCNDAKASQAFVFVRKD
jgi:SAM-dependent methyltransferase